MGEKRKLLSTSTPPFDDPSSTAEEEPSPAASDVPQPEPEDPAAPPEAIGPAEPSPKPEAEPERELEPEPERNLLETLPKDRLVELLLRAASRHPDVLDEVREVGGVVPEYRTVFLNGFGWDTTTEALKSFFSQYGEVEDCLAAHDMATGMSRGFVRFKHRSGARRAIKEPQKMIGNRMASCRLGLRRNPVSFAENVQRKLFVSNVSADIDPHKLRQFFEKFGEIEAGPFGLGMHTGKRRGLCLFVYKAVEGARNALEACDGMQLSGPLPTKAAAGYGGGAAAQVAPLGTGHLMAPSHATVGFNPSAQQEAVAANLTFGLCSQCRQPRI